MRTRKGGPAFGPWACQTIVTQKRQGGCGRGFAALHERAPCREIARMQTFPLALFDIFGGAASLRGLRCRQPVVSLHGRYGSQACYK
ncbi:hypothetical protein CT3_37140 [Comamonas terrigena NBRC 13299]|nr:hypothetical protein CT3_37140 [Comamonas terrigena NBRC 13299]